MQRADDISSRFFLGDHTGGNTAESAGVEDGFAVRWPSTLTVCCMFYLA